MAAYYNEIDPYAAEWLRNLIKAGHIADGAVDERSIADVVASDLAGFTQCHFFAGIGVWSLALRRAGWADDRPVWTGSCPCQPFSAAGKGNGFDDERHLWPAFHHLIEQRHPAVVFGEQVANKDAEPWLDLVQADLEALGYAFGAVPFPAAGVGAPNIRDRLYWMADSQRDHSGCQTEPANNREQKANGSSDRTCGCGCSSIILTNANNKGLEGRAGMPECSDKCVAGQNSMDGGMDNAECERFDAERNGYNSGYVGQLIGAAGEGSPGASPLNGFWADADWLLCRDGRWRPVEPGTFPLANGIANRVGRLRAYGNAIVAAQAQIFIEVAMESLNAKP
jgi:DNA (cytosine-5)-methyltransferase 1